MHERRVDHGDTRSEAEVGGAVGLVVLGTCQYPFERVVAEVDPLRRSRGTAGEHPYGDTRSGRLGDRSTRRSYDERLADVVRLQHGGRGRLVEESGNVVRLSGDQRELELGNVLPC